MRACTTLTWPPKSGCSLETAFQSFLKAHGQLPKAVKIAHGRELSEPERQGLIKAFEFTYELSWNTMKDFLEDPGVTDSR